MLTDLFIGLGAYLGAWLLRITIPLPYTQDLIEEFQFGQVDHPWLILVVSQVFVLYIFGLYDDLRTIRHREIVAYLSTGCVIQTLSITSALFLTQGIFPRTVILLFDILNVLFLFVWRIYLRHVAVKRILRVLIVGEDLNSVREIIREIEGNPWMGFRIVGLALSNKGLEVVEEKGDYPILGNTAKISSLLERYQIEQIIMASHQSWENQVLDSLSRFQEKRPLRVAILPSLYEIVIGKLRHINIHDTPLIEVKRNPNEPFERFLKRSLDVFGSVVCLILSSPFFLILSLLIKTVSSGQIFYLQERVGYGKRRFRLIKFRTMVPDAEIHSGAVNATPDDPRVIPMGRILRRFRLDELPQLVNVLKGDMSFVGPRPERPTFVEGFEATVSGYSERHKVKPGLTGLAQVRSYYDTSAENKLLYDLAYIYNYSFSLDLVILLETIKVVLVRRGS